MTRTAGKLTALRESLVAQVVATVTLHAALWPLVMRCGTLPAEAYFGASVVGGAVRHLPLLALWGAVLTPLLVGWRRLTWGALDPGRRARIPVVAAAGALAWAVATTDYNAFYDQAHLADRLLLVLAAAAVWAHPTFVPVCLLGTLAPLLSAIHYPLPDADWHWPDKRLPFDALVLFTAHLLVRLAVRPRPELLPVCFVGLVGAHYGQAAVSKLAVEPSITTWLFENATSNLVVSSFVQNHWLGIVGEERILKLAQALRGIDPLFAVGTIAVEGAGFFLLASRRFLLGALVAFIGLHLGIVATSGIFFWKWIVFDAAMIGYVSTLGRDAGEGGLPLHSWTARALAFAIAAGSKLYFHNVPFAWLDSRATNFFVLEGVGLSGRTYRLDPRFFAPYDVTFVQSRFYWATERPILVGTFGVSFDYATWRFLEVAKREELDVIRAARGRVYFDPALQERLGAFVHRYASEKPASFFPSRLAPPYHFQTCPTDAPYSHEEPLERIDVWLVETFYDGERLHRTPRIPVFRVVLGSPPPTPGVP